MKYDDDGRIFMVKSLSYGVLMGFFVLVHHIKKKCTSNGLKFNAYGQQSITIQFCTWNLDLFFGIVTL